MNALKVVWEPVAKPVQTYLGPTSAPACLVTPWISTNGLAMWMVSSFSFLWLKKYFRVQLAVSIVFRSEQYLTGPYSWCWLRYCIAALVWWLKNCVFYVVMGKWMKDGRYSSGKQENTQKQMKTNHDFLFSKVTLPLWSELWSLYYHVPTFTRRRQQHVRFWYLHHF